MAPLLLPLVRWSEGWLWSLAVAIAAVLALSIGVQLLGAAVRYETDSDNLAMMASVRFLPDLSDFARVATSQQAYAAEDWVMFDWRYFPIQEHARKVAERRDLVDRLRDILGQ